MPDPEKLKQKDKNKLTPAEKAKKLKKKKLEAAKKTSGALAALKSNVQKNPKKMRETMTEQSDDYARKQIEAEIRKLKGVDAIIGKIETFKDLRKLGVATLIKLEDKYEGILMYAFTDLVSSTKKVDFKNWKNYKNLKVGQKLKVHFHDNTGAYGDIGAADLLNINVTGIKVCSGGGSRCRTSTRRVGLKGQNKDSTGFFDDYGYIPIFTGDTIEITSVDNSMHDKYRKKIKGVHQPLDDDSYKKYEKSKKGKADKKYTKKSSKISASYISKRVKMPLSKIEKIREEIGAITGSPAQRVLKVAKYLARANKGIKARHCGNWVDRVFAIAGVKKKRGILFDLSYRKTSSNQRICDFSTSKKMRYARKAKPGDWVWLNNRNKGDRFGNHSGIIESVNMARGTYTLLSWFANDPSRQKRSTYSIKKYPIVQISRPA
jgi:hypothetical protein